MFYVLRRSLSRLYKNRALLLRPSPNPDKSGHAPWGDHVGCGEVRLRLVLGSLFQKNNKQKTTNSQSRWIYLRGRALTFLFYSHLVAHISEVLFLLRSGSRASLGAAMLVRSLPVKNRKRLAHDVINTFAAHPDLGHDVTGTDWLPTLTAVFSRLSNFFFVFNTLGHYSIGKLIFVFLFFIILFLFMQL